MLRFGATWIVVSAVLVALGNSAHGAVIFSYDPSAGQFPTDQGWGGWETDTTGPLTAASVGGAVTGTAANNANAAIEMVDGMNVLHIRDTLTDSTADLPEFYYPWTMAEQQLLLDNGLKFTMVVQGLTNATSNSNMRFGFNGTEFELQNDNISTDKTIQIQNFGAAPFPLDGQFHTLVVSGQKNGTNFEFAYTVDGGTSVPMTIDTNPATAGSAFESTVYFGALSSAGRNSDLLIKSVVMETVPEPSVVALLLLGVNGIIGGRRLRRAETNRLRHRGSVVGGSACDSRAGTAAPI